MVLPFHAGSEAYWRATYIAAPLEIPTSKPSCFARDLAVFPAFASSTVTISSITERSRFLGTKPAQYLGSYEATIAFA